MQKTRVPRATRAFTLLVLLVLLLVPARLFAHEVYILTNPEGEAGTSQEVELFWGHFPANPDPESDYFADLPQGRLYLLHPTREEEILEMTVQEDRYVTSFTPPTGGDYQVVFSHTRGVVDWQWSEPTGEHLAQNFAKAYVHVHGDEDIEAFDAAAGLDLDMVALTDTGHLHVGMEFVGQILYKGEPVEGAAVTLTDTEESTREVFTDEQGKFSVALEHSGSLLLKAASYEAREGSYAGAEFTGERATLSVSLATHEHDEEPPFSLRRQGIIVGSGIVFMVIALVLFKIGKKKS